MAVTEVRGDQQAVLRRDGQTAIDGNGSRRVSCGCLRRRSLVRIGAPLRIQLEDRLVILGIRFEALAASVRQRIGGLQQQQALFRIRQIDARNTVALDLGREYLVGSAFLDPLVVVSGVQGAGGKLETALTFHAAVAEAPLQPRFVRIPDDVACEHDRLHDVRICDPDGRACCASGKRCRDGYSSVLQRTDSRRGHEFR